MNLYDGFYDSIIFKIIIHAFEVPAISVLKYSLTRSKTHVVILENDPTGGNIGAATGGGGGIFRCLGGLRGVDGKGKRRLS